MKIIVAIAFLILCHFPAIATPQIIATCGASKGRAFFFEGGIVSPGQGGWKDDGFKDGFVAFTKENENYDIVFKDASGIRSYRKEGILVRLVKKDIETGTYLFLAMNIIKSAGFVESYLLRVNKIGLGIWYGRAPRPDRYVQRTRFSRRTVNKKPLAGLLYLLVPSIRSTIVKIGKIIGCEALLSPYFLNPMRS